MRAFHDFENVMLGLVCVAFGVIIGLYGNYHKASVPTKSACFNSGGSSFIDGIEDGKIVKECVWGNPVMEEK